MVCLRAEQLARVLGCCILFLATASCAVSLLAWKTGHPHLLGLFPLFELNHEMNVPTWFASSTLLFCALLLFAIGAGERARGEGDTPWRGLGLIFTAMSLDEVAGLHEISIGVIRLFYAPAGPLYYVWVVPGMLSVVLVAVVYAPWLRRLPARTRRLAVTSAVLFVGGAIGFEMIGGDLASRSQRDSVWYAIATTVEEVLEMSGVLVWIYTLADYARMRGFEVTVSFAATAGSGALGTAVGVAEESGR